jgi:hypothetical protein
MIWVVSRWRDVHTHNVSMTACVRGHMPIFFHSGSISNCYSIPPLVARGGRLPYTSQLQMKQEYSTRHGDNRRRMALVTTDDGIGVRLEPCVTYVDEWWRWCRDEPVPDADADAHAPRNAGGIDQISADQSRDSGASRNPGRMCLAAYMRTSLQSTRVQDGRPNFDFSGKTTNILIILNVI